MGRWRLLLIGTRGSLVSGERPETALIDLLDTGQCPKSITTSVSFAIGGDTAIGRLEVSSTCALRTEGI